MNFVKQLRLTLCLSQPELARELDISPSAISCYESGRREPNFQITRKLLAFAAKNGIDVNIGDIKLVK